MNWIRKNIAVSDRTTLNVEIGGSGPAVFFLHGIGGRARQWRGVAERLSVPACTMIWDARGYGDSVGPGASAFSDFADDLFAVLDALEIERALCVGHSMGGRILIEAAIRNPERLGALFISGAPSAFLSHFTPQESDGYVARRLALFNAGSMIEAKALGVAREVLPECAPQTLVSDLAEDLKSLRLDGYGAALAVSAGWDRSADLGALDMPCEVLGGALDKICPPSGVHALAEAISAEKVTVLDGVAHMGQLEAPEKVAALVSDFVARNAHLASVSSAERAQSI